MKYVPEWFPGAQFKREARLIKAMSENAVWLPYSIVKEKVGYDVSHQTPASITKVLSSSHSLEAANGTAPPSFVLSALEASQENPSAGLDDEIIAGVAVTMFGAGSETVCGSISDA